ncbi:hypothetical protein ACWCZ5_30400, partial [Streptomyces sp. NPDC001667]
PSAPAPHRPRLLPRPPRPLHHRIGSQIVSAQYPAKEESSSSDYQGLDDAWTTDVLPDLGSQWGQYEYVTNVGFAA